MPDEENGTAPEVVTAVVRTRGGARALAGGPPKSASVFLARNKPVLAARWVRSCKRALAYLNNPQSPIDADWIRLFNSLADRLGYARVSEQRVDSTQITANVTPDFVKQVVQAANAQVRELEAAEAVREGKRDKTRIH